MTLKVAKIQENNH